MRTHLITTVGGHVDVLPHMLAHYQSLGIESFFVNLHLKNQSDPVREQVETITREFGSGIACIAVGDWQMALMEAYLTPRELYPSDWFVLADQDELQVYPGSLPDVFADCQGHGWDYVRGMFVDRLARDGGFPPVLPGSIWEQFPMGAFFSARVLHAEPRKVVAVHGPVPLAKGQHRALEGRPAPSREYYVPVHHFKWTEGVAGRLETRAAQLREQGFSQWAESAYFLEYLRQTGGRVNLADPNLFIAECKPEYPHWEAVKKLALAAAPPQ